MAKTWFKSREFNNLKQRTITVKKFFWKFFISFPTIFSASQRLLSFWAKIFFICLLCGFLQLHLFFSAVLQRNQNNTGRYSMIILFSESVHLFRYLHKITKKFKKRNKVNKQTDKTLEILHHSKWLTLPITLDFGLIITNFLLPSKRNLNNLSFRCYRPTSL